MVDNKNILTVDFHVNPSIKLLIWIFILYRLYSEVIENNYYSACVTYDSWLESYKQLIVN